MLNNNIGARTPLAVGLFLAAAPLVAQADLTYENVNGTGLIYDSSDNTTWTQNGDISGSIFTYQAANAWAAALTVSGVNSSWALPTAAEFTSLFSQLEAPATINGHPNLPDPPYDGSKYGSQILFGAGANEYALNVVGTYWTSASEVDFNFYYGFPGSGGPGQYFDNSTLYSAWAVEATPEPSAGLMGLIACGVLGGSLRMRRRPVRV